MELEKEGSITDTKKEEEVKELSQKELINNLIQRLLLSMEYDSYPLMDMSMLRSADDLVFNNYRELLYRVVSAHQELGVISLEELMTFNTLFSFLSNRTNFFDVPASAKYHGSVNHGLFYHTMNVLRLYPSVLMGYLPLFNINYKGVDSLREWIPFNDFKYLCRSLLLCCFAHDLGKLGQLDTSSDSFISRYIKDESGKFIYNKNLVQLDVPPLSVYYTAKFFDLSPIEIQAIMYHDGPYAERPEFLNLRESVLLTLVHHCDYLAGIMLESGKNFFLSTGV